MLLLAAAVAVGAFLFLDDTAPEDVLFSNVTAKPLQSGALIVTFSMENADDPQRITGASVPDGRAMIAGGSGEIVVPTGASSVAPEGSHVMIMPFADKPQAGALVPLTLEFEGGGEATMRARVAEATGEIDHSTMQHGLDLVDVPRPDAPSVAIEVAQSDSGWRVTVTTARFEFAQNAVDQPHVMGQGHGHLYVSGTKIGRVFGNTAEIGHLPPGQHEVLVTLNTNDHKTYSTGGSAIAARALITAK